MGANTPRNEVEFIDMSSTVNHEYHWGTAETTTLLEYDIAFQDLPYSARTHQFFSGFAPEISFAGFQMETTRHSTSYLLNYYLPSALFVIVNWTTFVIPVQAIPGRMGLIITTFLALANIANSAFANSPTAHGVNFIQVGSDFLSI